MTALQTKAIYRLSAMMPFVLGATFLAPGEATAGITLKGCGNGGILELQLLMHPKVGGLLKKGKWKLNGMGLVRTRRKI